MKSFKQYISENTIHFFDMDETLFTHGNRTKIHVKHSNGKISSLTNQQYNKYKKRPGDQPDYSEFRSAHHFEKSARPIHSVLRMLHNISKKHKVEIMTAREDFDNKDHFGQVLAKHGIDFYKVHVRRAGNYHGTGSHEKKANHISDLIQKHKYTQVHLYDDHLHNLNSFLDLKKKHPFVTFHAYHVKTVKGKTKVKRYAKV
jgi:hypothetical protein